MAGELYEVRGSLRWSESAPCPPTLVGKKATLKSEDGFISQIPAEAACTSSTIRDILLRSGTEDEITLPLQQTIISKVLEFMNYHATVPAAEIMNPLDGDSLGDSGASKWDVAFINVEKEIVLDLILAASVLGIKSLFFLAAAKAALMTKGKEGRKLRKDFGLTDDLPGDEEETLLQEFNNGLGKKGRWQDQKETSDDLAGPTAILAGVVQAASKQKALTGNQTVSLKSFRHAQWRVAVLQDWTVLERAPEEVQGDRDLVLAALMSSGGRAIVSASDELKADGELILEAVKGYPRALAEAVEELKDERDFLLQCVVANGEAMAHCDASTKQDRSFLLEAAKRGCGSALKGATDDLKYDADFVLEVVDLAPEAFQYCAADLKKDKEFALRAAKRNGMVLQYMSSSFRADRQIVATAVGQDEGAVLFSHVARRADAGFELPWDPDSTSQVARMPFATPGELPQMHTGEDGFGVAVEKYGKVFKAGRLIQFSASNTLQANMGQANYIAANSFLDKLPFYSRPEMESTTMMWGAVGNIGMRLKAFGSQDFLNATPEAQTTLEEARKMLYILTCMSGGPEWYNEQMYDPATRAAVLAPTAGYGSGGGWKPGEDASLHLPPGFATPGPPSKKEQAGEGKERKHLDAQAASSPLSSWPALQPGGGGVFSTGPRGGLPVEGARVRLVSMRAKNGVLGTLVKSCSDGRWKIQMDGDHGMATLKSEYFQVLGPDEEVDALPPPPPPPATLQPKVASNDAAAAQLAQPKPKLRDAYYVVGTWSNFSEPKEMLWSHSQRCWKFKFRLAFSTESFQILLDGSWDKCLHPGKQIDSCPGTEYALAGPDAKRDCRGLHWTVGSHPSDSGVRGSQYEIRLLVSKEGKAEKLTLERLDDPGKTSSAAPA
jgi:hypothetical protein